MTIELVGFLFFLYTEQTFCVIYTTVQNATIPHFVVMEKKKQMIKNCAENPLIKYNWETFLYSYKFQLQ